MRYVVGPTSSIPPGTVTVVHPKEGDPGVGIFNLDGEFYALRNACPHMGAPLCRGVIRGTAEASMHADGRREIQWVRDGEIITCPWHAWEFEIRTGRTVFPSRSRARRYEVAVEPPEVMERLRKGAETVPVTVDEMMVVLEI